MKKLIECVPNFSEGRDLNIIKQITDQIETVEGVDAYVVALSDNYKAYYNVDSGLKMQTVQTVSQAGQTVRWRGKSASTKTKRTFILLPERSNAPGTMNRTANWQKNSAKIQKKMPST